MLVKDNIADWIQRRRTVSDGNINAKGRAGGSAIFIRNRQSDLAVANLPDGGSNPESPIASGSPKHDSIVWKQRRIGGDSRDQEIFRRGFEIGYHERNISA